MTIGEMENWRSFFVLPPPAVGNYFFW